MMSSEYFTPAGYLTDGGIVCVNCGDKRKLPVADQILESTVASDFEEHGLACDDCGAVIVEPSEVYYYDDEYHGDEDDEEGGDLETD
jgi:hypothetical protein